MLMWNTKHCHELKNRNKRSLAFRNKKIHVKDKEKYNVIECLMSFVHG